MRKYMRSFCLCISETTVLVPKTEDLYWKPAAYQETKSQTDCTNQTCNTLHRSQVASDILSIQETQSDERRLRENKSMDQADRIQFLKNACEKYSREFYSDLLFNSSQLTLLFHGIKKRSWKFGKFHKRQYRLMNRDRNSVSSVEYDTMKDMSTTPSSERYYCNKKYAFCICSVPKSGCTFWSQIFQIIGKKKGYTFDSVFNKPRSNVHKLGNKYRTGFEDVVRNKMRTVLISRDPYSRLYSAFIDKIYLLNIGSIFVQKLLAVSKGVPVRQLDNCAENNVTFQEFLQFIVNRAKTIPDLKYMDVHWAPISALCNPCLVNPYSIVKQESFTEDTEYSLKVLNIDSKHYDFIIDALYNKGSDIGTEELVQTLELSEADQKSKHNKVCLTSVQIAFRIWKSFQIQGYIDDKATFPWHSVDTKADTLFSMNLTHLVATVRNKYPMTPERKKNQRRKYLIEAYKTIDRHIIIELQKIYRDDFVLYNYDREPPV